MLLRVRNNDRFGELFNPPLTMATNEDLLRVLRDIYDRGQRRVAASTVAEILWPGGRTQNANGQVFPLSAGIAGRMLRRCKAVVEVRNREWEILPHRLPPR